jgi:uncharacterized protein YeaO (DUF488 family)
LIRTAHINTLPPRDQGFRVLVTRKWPRGIPRTAVDMWARDLGGSPELLKEYKKGKIPVAAFKARYRAETSEPGRNEAVYDLQRRSIKNGEDLILLCDCDDEEGSVRIALKEILETV